MIFDSVLEIWLINEKWGAEIRNLVLFSCHDFIKYDKFYFLNDDEICWYNIITNVYLSKRTVQRIIKNLIVDMP